MTKIQLINVLESISGNCEVDVLWDGCVRSPIHKIVDDPKNHRIILTTDYSGVFIQDMYPEELVVYTNPDV